MNSNEVIRVLNDLIRINTARVQEYEKAMTEMENGGSDSSADVTEAFSEMARKSQVFKNELLGEVLRLGGDPESPRDKNSGNVYRFWEDLNSSSSDKNVLEWCEFVEDATLKTYEEVLENSLSFPEDTYEIIRNQRDSLEASYGVVKQYKDTF